MRFRIASLIQLLMFAWWAPALGQEPCGELPPVARQVLTQLGDQFSELRRSADDDQRRRFARKAAEQMAFSVSPEWGTKSAGAGRPPSKDAIARHVAGRLCSWDIVNGATRELQFNSGEDITEGQIFIPVTPTDHLGFAPDVIRIDQPIKVDAEGFVKLKLEPVLEAIANLRQQVSTLHEQIAQLFIEFQEAQIQGRDIEGRLRELQARPFPVYSAKLFGVKRLTLRPQQP